MTNPTNELLFDADVLIDLCEVDSSFIKLISENIARAHIATRVLQEVEALSPSRCASLSLLVERPTTEELLAAGKLDCTISFADKVCLIMSRERGWTCVTNDRKLRSCCSKHRVRTRRGLRMVVDLVRAGVVSKKHAVNVAENIAQSNPGHIGVTVLARFKAELELD